jgi:hypothetical protein
MPDAAILDVTHLSPLKITYTDGVRRQDFLRRPAESCGCEGWASPNDSGVGRCHLRNLLARALCA